MSLNKTYQPQNIETSCYQTWLNEGYFSPTQEKAGAITLALLRKWWSSDNCSNKAYRAMI